MMFAHLFLSPESRSCSVIVIVSNDFNLTRLRDDDDGAAKTGVTETTTEAAVYSHPTNDKIKFWDLPGIGMYNQYGELAHCKKSPSIFT